MKKLTHIALAVASLGVASANASSLPGLSNAPNNIPVGNQIFISGASALSASVAGVVGSLCTGTVTPVSCGSAGVTVLCSIGSAASGFLNAPFAVIKRDTDGSFAGVGNVISQTPITGWCDRMGTAAANNTTLLIAPDAGLTDVDTSVWRGLANTGALTQSVPPPVAVITNGGFAGQGFGVMVSENLYRAMQGVQRTEGRLPASCTTAADPSFLPGLCQPSISKEEYTAIADGTNFNYINSTALTGTTNPINLCRRVETSGTQAASNVYFLNNSCANANPTFGFKPPKTVIFPPNGGGVVVSGTGVAANGNYEEFPGQFSIFEGSGTGDARNCISNRNTGRNPSNLPTIDSDQSASNGFDGLGFYAIGVISLENAPATGRRYLKLDGVSPTAYQVPVSGTEDMLDVSADLPGFPGSGIAGSGAADGWAQDRTRRISVVRSYYDFAPELEMLWPTTTGFSTSLNAIRTGFTTANLLGVFAANTGTGTHAADPTRVHKGTRNGNFCTPQVLAE